jgi:hypothetical protein
MSNQNTKGGEPLKREKPQKAGLITKRWQRFFKSEPFSVVEVRKLTWGYKLS